MSDIKESIIKDLFESITGNLIKKSDGKYIFKSNKFQMSSQIRLGHNLKQDPACIPSIEELGDFFEREIVSKVPYAILLVFGDLAISVNIDPENEYLEKYHLAQKEVDIYESLKTLFFPTMKEILMKNGASNPQVIYNHNRKYKVFRKKTVIYFQSPSVKIQRGIEGSAIDFLKEDLDFFFNELKFKNPIPKDSINLPQADILLEDLLSDSNRKKKGYLPSELYSYKQKINLLKQLINDFIEYYPKIIIDNFPRFRNSFFLYSNQPLKITIYTEKYQNDNKLEDFKTLFIYERLNEGEDNQFELIENEIGEYDPEKHLYAVQYFSSDLFIRESIIHRSYCTSDNVLTSEIYGLNAIPFTYQVIRKELDDILARFREDSIFDEVKPFEIFVEQWIKTILDTEEKGGEDYNIELKSAPAESKKGDGTGNDIYGQINAFENAEGGYIFIGVDESKKGIEKIIGLEPYLRDKNKNLDQLKREIRQKCFNYLGKDNYRIDSRIYKGKSIIRIRVPSNHGDISWFKTSDGSLKVYTRRNGEKKQLTPHEIDDRKEKYLKKIIK